MMGTTFLDKEQKRSYHRRLLNVLLEQLQCNGPFRLSFNTLAPKFEFWVDGTVEDEVPDKALCMEGTDWGMMGYLLRYQPETLLLSVEGRGG